MIKRMLKPGPLALAVATIGLCASAQAASIKNLDGSEHRLVIVEGQSRVEHTIGSKLELTDVCGSVCSVYIEGDPEPYEVRATDKIEIEEGALFYLEESPEAPRN